MEVGGVNHQCFLSKLMIQGQGSHEGYPSGHARIRGKLEDNLLDTHREEVVVQQDLFRAIRKLAVLRPLAPRPSSTSTLIPNAE